MLQLSASIPLDGKMTGERICSQYRNQDCTGSPVLPVPPPGPGVPFLPSMFLPDLLVVVQLVGKAAVCNAPL